MSGSQILHFQMQLFERFSRAPHRDTINHFVLLIVRIKSCYNRPNFRASLNRKFQIRKVCAGDFCTDKTACRRPRFW